MTSASQHFERRLRRSRRWWQLGMGLDGLLRLLSALLIAIVVYAVLDFFLAFSDTARMALSGGLALVAFAAFVVVVCRISTVRTEDGAARLDRVAGDRRQTLLSALELGRAESGSGELGAYLIGRSVERAETRLTAVPWRAVFPLAQVSKRGVTLGVQLLAFVAAAVVAGTAARVILARIATPGRDVPPYSRYRFEIEPQQARVLYDGTLDVRARITGAAVRDQVWFLTRYGGRTLRAACFQERDGRAAQRLEHVVNPVEFCFAVGKARSPWYPVQILMQPQIATAHMVVTPPAYAGSTPRDFLVGNEDAAGLAGSHATLQVTSNRRLAEGTLTIVPEKGGDELVVPGRTVAPHTVAFDWDMRHPARLDVVIRDIQGTPNDKPFSLRQTILPDAPPEVVITDPEPFVVATPKAQLQLAGFAEDDLGLVRIDLVRTVAGYRDRVVDVGPPARPTRHDYTRALDLRRIGAAAGQTLEFYTEARDSNPNLLGFAASDIVRVQVISEEDYANMLRMQITANEFAERFRLALDAVRQVRESMEALRDDLAAESLSPDERQARFEALKKLQREARDRLQQLAGDFAVYDLEKAFEQSLGHTAALMERHDAILGRLDPQAPGLAQELSRMLAELGPEEAAMEAQQRDADEVARVARVMEMAVSFRQLVARQERLVRQLERVRSPAAAPDAVLLGMAQRTQDEIREALLTFRTDLTNRCAALPPTGYEALQESAQAFLDALDALEVPPIMRGAVTAARNQDGPRTYQQAALALERLQQLIEDCSGSCFGGMCRGGELTFSVKDGLRKTLAQMLAAMGNGSGFGPGVGAGGGGSGDENDGYWGSGYTLLNTPVYGPQRTRLAEPQAATGWGNNNRPGPGSGARIRDDASEQLNIEGSQRSAARSVPIEQVPEKYREAVKRYFSE